MNLLHSVQIHTEHFNKEISVYCDDVTAFEDKIDVLVTSAFGYSYAPTPRTVFNALYQKGIKVDELASRPEIDLRHFCNVWLSKKLPYNPTNIKRIGCVEFITKHYEPDEDSEKEQNILNSIQAFFKMLEIASVYNIDISTVALPLLGSGVQQVSEDLIITPLLNECVSFLKRNPSVKRILFIEKNPEKAQQIADNLKKSLRFIKKEKIVEPIVKKQKGLAFISYSSADKNIADNLCFKLESKGIKVWYAPRDVKGPYAEAITKAIEASSRFIVILSKNSIKSEHVLNEIDLAFQKLPNNIEFHPLRIDNAMFTPAFKYYLSRQHWLDATSPPLEERLNEFVRSLTE